LYLGAGGKTKLVTSFDPSSGQLTATLPGNFLGPFGSTNDIEVSTAPPGGGVTAPPLATFKILAPIPANDNFAAAIDLGSIPSPNIQDTSAATTEASDPVPPCGQLLGAPSNVAFGKSNSIWYKFTPATNGLLSLSLGGSSYVSWLSVWTGAQSSLVPVANACSGFPVARVAAQPQLPGLTVSGGTAYYIMVGSVGPVVSSAFIAAPIVPNPIAFGGRSVFAFSFVGTPDFLMQTQGSASATVSAGSPATYSLTIADANGFASNINVTCSSNAAATTCSANPASVAPGTNTTTITVTTTAHQLFPPSRPPRRFGPRQRFVPLAVLLTLALLLVVFAARSRRQRLAISIPLAGIILLLVLEAQGCGGSGNGSPALHGTQPGNYTVTITGNSGATSHAITVSLVVN